MNDPEGVSSRRGILSRFWRFLWRPSTAVPLAGLLIVGFVGGIVFWGAFHWFLEYTSTEEFCISCHEMRDHSYTDLKETIHFVNRTGTRAICTDCHVPKEFIRKIGAKIVATKDLFFHLTGKIDTPEKYEAHRLGMALWVWDEMKANNSRECRNCHQNVWTDTSAEFGGAARHHKLALQAGNMTCIDCHQGIAHTLPKEFVRPEDDKLFADPNAWLVALQAIAAGKN
jgi:cytochrome c-type protein NapC